MWIKCGSPVINSALSSLQIIPSTHLSYLPSSSLSASIQEQHSSPSVNWTELPSINFNFTITTNLDSSSMSYLSLSTVSSTNHSYLSLSTVAPTESFSTWSSFSTTASGTLSSVPVTSQSTRRMSQSGDHWHPSQPISAYLLSLYCYPIKWEVAVQFAFVRDGDLIKSLLCRVACFVFL